MRRLTGIGFWAVGAACVPPFLVAALSVADTREVARHWWEPIGPPGGSVWALASHPSQPWRVFAAVGKGGVFISRDGGETWLEFELPGARWPVEAIKFDPLDPSTIYAAAKSLYRSHDGGLSWTEVRFFSDNTPGGWSAQPVIAIDPNDSDTVIVGFEHRLHLSRDGGDNWSRIDERFMDLDPRMKIGSVAVDPNNSLRFYVAHNSYSTGDRLGPDGNGVWVSPDRGSHWEPMNSGLAVRDVLSLWVGLDGSIGVGSDGGGVDVHTPRFPRRPTGRRTVR